MLTWWPDLTCTRAATEPISPCTSSPAASSAARLPTPQTEPERLEPGRGAGAVTVGLPLSLAPPRHLGLGQIQRGRGLLVGGVQARFVLLVGSDRRLQNCKLTLGPGCAGPALFDGLPEPADLGLAGLHPAAPCAKAGRQQGKSLAAICSGSDETGESSGLRGIPDLDLDLVGDCGVQRLPGLGGLGDQSLLTNSALKRPARAASGS